ncbi:MAG: hypothetical protein HYZ34_00435 [Ignavibacteriae bacterium]|nr:hypothetical protein [Ignavibacteriota bacterium]
MLNLNREFLTFIKLLHENNVEYLLIGGYAVNYFGYARPTGDLDIWVNPTNENHDKLIKALKHFHYNTEKLAEKDFTQPVAFFLGEPPFQIDVLNRISGIHFSDAYSRRNILTIKDVQIQIIHLQDLRINKLVSGRHRDLDDLENLPES